MITLKDIRATYLNFFTERGHTVVQSSPLIPQNDPTLMFNNAGMNQFKDVFIGRETRDYKRAVSCQKCVRAGGKHNDLDNVGYTARHHTFFEMLGNFSFGDYFKEEAIAFSWELVTKVFKLPKEKLMVTIHISDDEARNIWKKVSGFSDDKIVALDKDNFWSMGDTGPCGPSTEIFYDYGEGIAGGPPGSPDEDGDRFVEIWNNVFMQYETLSDGSRINLPKPSIDTGMGLERMASVLQGKTTNYDTDLFIKLRQDIAEKTGVDWQDEKFMVCHKVIADHLRTASFLIAEGITPSNEGRGYVLRRIMRRAMRYIHMLGYKDILLPEIFPTLQAEMGDVYPELIYTADVITATLRGEEERFKQTLDKGLKILADESAELKAGDKFSGEKAFKLYDTYGFPLDLTQDALRIKNITVDEQGFTASMEAQRAAARKNWAGSGDAREENIWFELKPKTGATEFLGYADFENQGLVLALVKDGKEVKSVKAGDEINLITNQTPFYGECGGQVGDSGTIVTEKGAKIVVTDTLKKLGDLIVHVGKVEKGEISIGETITLKIDAIRRLRIAAHHSAAHLLQHALREVLGKHIMQKGSYVDENRLRFDISHNQSVSKKEIREVDKLVNEYIRANTSTLTRVMDMETAMKEGAIALFGEKYGEEVRLLTIGPSIELCGGTHVKRTGDIGGFKIIGEESLAAGVRRIEAVCGAAFIEWVNNLEDSFNDSVLALQCGPAEIVDVIEKKKSHISKLEKELSEARKKSVLGSSVDKKEIGNITFVKNETSGLAPKDLKGIADELKKQSGANSVVALINTSEDGKICVVVGVGDGLTNKFSAIELATTASQILGGVKAGGRADLAQGGGSDSAKIVEAFASIEKALT